jgi:hypothetical protein
MGEYRLIYTAIGGIAIVIAILAGKYIVVTNFYNADIDSQITQREVNSMSISYRLLECMYGDKDSVPIDFLEQSTTKNICEICGVCNILAETRITDLESDPIREWSFEYSSIAGLSQFLKDKLFVWREDRQKKASSVYLNIDYGDYSHVGRLDVNV